MPRLLRWLASIGSGLVLWASYPRLDAGWLVWVALIPLLSVLWGRAPLKARHGFGYGCVTGVVFFSLSFKWLWHVAGPAVLLLGLYLGLYVGMWGAFVATIGRPRPGEVLAGVMRLVSISAAWTGLEWLRGVVFTGFGWNGLGVALRHSPVLASQAEWLGVTGLSFWVVLPQAAVVAFIATGSAGSGWMKSRIREGTGSLVALLMFSAFCGGAYLRWAREDIAHGRAIPTPGETIALRVALIQPNIPQEVKNLRDEFEPIAQSLARLTEQAASAEPPPSLIVWPESALPSTIDDPAVTGFVEETLALGDFTLALGIDEQLMDRFYNSVAVARGSVRSLTVHAKVHLVPFGEYLPVRGILGKVALIRELLPGDFRPGESTEPVPLPGTEVGIIPLVCFEDTIGRVARKFARPGPQIIVNVTNDAWFQDSEGADQHLANAVFRCLELRRPMIRAANTGVTAVINAHGEVTHRLPRLQEGVLTATVAVADAGYPLTFYARHGDLFAHILLVLAGVALVWSRVRVRKKRQVGP